MKGCMLRLRLWVWRWSVGLTRSAMYFMSSLQRSRALSVAEHRLIALRFYTYGTFHQVIGDNMGERKSTVSNVVKALSVALVSLINQFVSFLKDDQTAQTKHKFFFKWGTCLALLVLLIALLCISKHLVKGSGSMSIERGGTASTSNLWETLTS